MDNHQEHYLLQGLYLKGEFKAKTFLVPDCVCWAGESSAVGQRGDVTETEQAMIRSDQRQAEDLGCSYQETIGRIGMRER